MIAHSSGDFNVKNIHNRRFYTGVWKSGEPESGIGTGIGTVTGSGTGMGTETSIKTGTTFTLISVNLDLIPIQIICEK